MHRLPRHNIIRVFEGFAGHRGATFGLRRSGIRHRVVGYSDVDEDAINLYLDYFPNIQNLDDITQIGPNSRHFPNLDLFTEGFPYQPFSVAGLKRGFETTNKTGMFLGILCLKKCIYKHNSRLKIL